MERYMLNHDTIILMSIDILQIRYPAYKLQDKIKDETCKSYASACD
jgi:hypothetical protein